MNNTMQLVCGALLISSVAGLASATLPALGLCTTTSQIYMIAIASFRFFTAYAAGAFMGPEFNTKFTSRFALGAFALLIYFVPTELVAGLVVGFGTTNPHIIDIPREDEDNNSSPFKAERAPQTGFSNLVQVPAVTEQLKQIASIILDVQKGHNPYNLTPPIGILMYGPPGTGKTALTRALANELDASIFVVPASCILAKYLGETEGKIRTLFDAAIAQRLKEPEKPVIIFMDEIDALGKRSDERQVASKVAMPALIQHLDGYHRLPQGILFVGATNCMDNVDPALKDRVKCIETKPPTKKQRQELFGKYIGDLPIEDSLTLEALAEKTDGYSCRMICDSITNAKTTAHLDTERSPVQLLKQDFSAVLDQATT